MTRIMTTSDFVRLFRKTEDETPKYSGLDDRGRPFETFTTGRLEKALAAGERVIVISSRSKVGEHDNWWMDLVPVEDIHFYPHIWSENMMLTIWAQKTLESKYGITWPLEDNGDPMHWTSGLREINKVQVTPLPA